MNKQWHEKAVLLNALFFVVALVLCGCATHSKDIAQLGKNHSDKLAREHFFRMLDDCKRANASAIPAISLFTSHYWLPASTDALVQMGTNAISTHYD